MVNHPPGSVVLIIGIGLLAWTEASAILPGGCIQPETPRPEKPLVVGDVLHATHGINVEGYLCSGPYEVAASHQWDRQPRARVPVSIDVVSSGHDTRVMVTVVRTTGFRMILRSAYGLEFEDFTFSGVEPGSYVFTLEPRIWLEAPIDVDLKYWGRTVQTKSVYAEVLNHP